MLIKLLKTTTISGTEWKKGTVLEAVQPDAEKAIKDGFAELVCLSNKNSEPQEVKYLKSELEETRKQLEELKVLNEELTKQVASKK